MSKRKISLILVLVMAVTTLLLAACGPKDDGELAKVGGDLAPADQQLAPKLTPNSGDVVVQPTTNPQDLTVNPEQKQPKEQLATPVPTAILLGPDGKKESSGVAAPDEPTPTPTLPPSVNQDGPGISGNKQQ